MHLKLSFGAKGTWVAISILLASIATGYSNASALTGEEITAIEAYEKVAPSVVNITTHMCEAEFFFCATPTITGSGSGVVLREERTDHYEQPRCLRSAGYPGRALRR